MTLRFDVNDAELRETFLRTEATLALQRLSPDTPARWGRMTAAEMVEHLLWAFEISTGRVKVDCSTAPDDLPRMKRFLHSNRPTPQDFMNPALAEGLPALRYPDLGEAKAALEFEIRRFLDEFPRSDALVMHTIFGPLGYEDWHRTQYKHTHHHLLQFGLIEVEATPILR